MRAHDLIYFDLLASNMRPINVTLDSVTWELAKQKTNFSEWVRNQLRSERNKSEQHKRLELWEMSTERIEYELKRRSEEE